MIEMGKQYRTGDGREVRKGNYSHPRKCALAPRDEAWLLDRVTPEPNSGCWLWTAGLYSGGYGMASLGARNHYTQAHRLSWQIHKGPIPEGLYVLHRCDVRSCINPDHLWLGTYADNNRDMVAKGRHWRSKRSA